ncbi:hypothetical protein KIH74_28730 [Kineosporia sp. J2-2]|uniref:Uncharacterized protein n=1 Tax=Kineosporia corallincola TaxID=2835133 RepID=A0ABS5TR23_9ACTN|nr:hypothetical protein [Kineosporia corallincola]MBT0772963.1 hypothetical protein [Kineosporia corallincola]
MKSALHAVRPVSRPEPARLHVVVIPHHTETPVWVQQITGDPQAALEKLVGGPLQATGLDDLPAVLLSSDIDVSRRGPAEDTHNVRATLLAWAHHQQIRFRFHLHGTVVIVGTTLPDIDPAPVPAPGGVVRATDPVPGSPREAAPAGQYTSAPAQLIDLLLHTPWVRAEYTTRRRPGQWVRGRLVHPGWYEAYTSLIAQAFEWERDADRMRIAPAVAPEHAHRWVNTANRVLHGRGAPGITPEDIIPTTTVDELAQAIAHGRLRAGTAVQYQDLCVVNLADGREEWMAMHQQVVLRIAELRPSVAEGTFAHIVAVLMATPPDSGSTDPTGPRAPGR